MLTPPPRALFAQECVALHQQAAVVLSLLRRLRQYCRPRLPPAAAAAGQLRRAGSAQLRRVADHLLESLLALSAASRPVPSPSTPPLPTLTPPLCLRLFEELCVHGSPRVQLAAGTLLLAAAGQQAWWGGLMADTFCRMFAHTEDRKFCEQRLVTTHGSMRSGDGARERKGILSEGLLVVGSRVTYCTRKAGCPRAEWPSVIFYATSFI